MRQYMALLAALTAVGARAVPAVDDHVTFFCSFDRDTQPDYCRGNWDTPGGGTIVPGCQGSAFSGTPRGVAYPVPGNLPFAACSIDLWLQPRWLQTNGRAAILALKTDTGDYLNVNMIAGNRLGFALRGGGETWTYKRVDADISGWQADDWHRLGLAWGPGEMRLYLDGKPAGEADQCPTLTGKADTFTLGAGDMVLDELRISDVVRTPEEFAAPRETTVPPAYLSTVTHRGEGRWAANGLPDRAHLKLPLLLGGRVYARGFGMVAPARITVDLTGAAIRMVGMAGISEISPDGAGAKLEILADDQPVWSHSGPDAREVSVNLDGIHQLTLVATGTTPDRPVLVTWGEMRLLMEGDKAPQAFARAATDLDLGMSRLKLDSDRFAFTLPGDAPYVLYAKAPFDTLPGVPKEPTGLTPWPAELSVFAAPGEAEPFSLLVAARERMPEVKVAVSELRGVAGKLPASCVDARTVLRGPQRLGYWMPRDRQEITSRFLLPYEPFDLDAGQFREVFLTVHVPADAKPGTYRGIITVEPPLAGSEVPISVRVLPIQLPPTRRHAYGMYYHMQTALSDPERVALELEDMRRHGCTMLFPSVGLRYVKEGDAIRPDLTDLERTLAVMQAHGFVGTVPVQDNLIALGRLMGYDVGGEDNKTSAQMEADPKVAAVVREALESARQLQQTRFPDLPLAWTHMDEVFWSGRMPLYLQLARQVRAASPLPIYMTIHTVPNSGWEQMMAESDPYMDIRCFNGHALDDWIRDGHSFAQMREQMEPSGDRLWTYYNMRGSFFTPLWCRVVNGYYLWITPLEVHMPWMYHSYGGDPFDDTDSDDYDFGYAVPSAQDGKTPVSTLHWEAFREGVDDMRYLELLEDLTAQAEGRNLPAAQAGRTWLMELAGKMPRLPEDVQNIEGESPILIWFSRHMPGDALQALRLRTAEEIIKLQAALAAQ